MKIPRVILLILVCYSVADCQMSISITKLNDLSFGTDIGGKVRRIASIGAGAAKFLIRSEKDADATIIVMLPTEFTGTNGVPPISATYDERSAAWSTTDESSSQTFFDPRRPLILRLSAHQNTYVWIGGIVNPPAIQRAGTYSGAITVSVTTQPGR